MIYSKLQHRLTQMKDAILQKRLELMECLRTLSHQIEQKHYMLLEHKKNIQHISDGIQEFHKLQENYNLKYAALDAEIQELKNDI